MPEIEALLKLARDHVMTDEEWREQRIGFAFGNIHMHNPDVTRAMIELQAGELTTTR